MSQIINYLLISWKIIHIDLKKLKEYRSEFFANFMSAPIKLIIYAGLWYIITIYNSNSNISFNWIISYFVNVIIFEVLITPFCVITYDLMNDIKTGNLDIYLVKPYPYLSMKFFSNSKTFILFFPILFLNIILNFKSISLKEFIFVLILHITVIILVYLLFIIVGIFSFYIESVLALRDNMWNLIRLFSGSIIPISMYPEWLKNIANFLPFKYIYYEPINIILSGSITVNDIILQILWIALLFIIVEIMWKISLKRYSSQGG